MSYPPNGTPNDDDRSADEIPELNSESSSPSGEYNYWGDAGKTPSNRVLIRIITILVVAVTVMSLLFWTLQYLNPPSGPVIDKRPNALSLAKKI